MHIPTWIELALLALAAFRTWKLLAEDVILDRPRAWVVKRGGEYVETLLECPWCAGFWISLAWFAAYELWPHGTVVVAIAPALSGIIGIIAWITSD